MIRRAAGAKPVVHPECTNARIESLARQGWDLAVYFTNAGADVAQDIRIAIITDDRKGHIEVPQDLDVGNLAPKQRREARIRSRLVARPAKVAVCVSYVAGKAWWVVSQRTWELFAGAPMDSSFGFGSGGMGYLAEVDFFDSRQNCVERARSSL